MRIYDLSMIVSNELPTYPGDPVVSLSPKITFEQSGFNVLSICMGSHSGTHLDVPRHMIDQGLTVDVLAIDKFIGQALFVEILKNENEEITVDDIKDLDLRKDDILIIRTGWEKNKYKMDFFYGFPYFSVDVADYLISKNIKAVGADIPTVDGPGQNAAFHKKLMLAEVIIIEALINLKQMVGKRMYFSALPIKIKDADGSPVRAVAFEL